jgi:hypothetical protein
VKILFWALLSRRQFKTAFVAPYSLDEMSVFLDVYTHEKKATTSYRNVGNQLTSDATSESRRT